MTLVSRQLTTALPRVLGWASCFGSPNVALDRWPRQGSVTLQRLIAQAYERCGVVQPHATERGDGASLLSDLLVLGHRYGMVGTRRGAVAHVEGRSVHLGVELRIIRQLRRRQRAKADAAEGHESRGDLELCTRHLTRGGWSGMVWSRRRNGRRREIGRSR